MFLQRSNRRWMAIALLATALAACGGGGGGGDPDTTAPTATLDLPGGALEKSRPLVITFSEAMDAASLQLGGSLGSEALAEWSPTAIRDSKLTLTPRDGAWSGGATRVLRVDAKDRAGNPLPTLEATYQVNTLFATFQQAEVVIGQPDFAANAPDRGGPLAANTLEYPSAAAVAASGTLFIADTLNHRVVAYPGVPTANGAAASFVLGQPNLQSDAAGVGENTFAVPNGVSIGAGRLVVADTYNSRVLIYGSVPVDESARPAVVLGQPNFDSAIPACRPGGMAAPVAAMITENGKVLVADSEGARVMIWNSIPTESGRDPDVVLGQSNMTSCASGPVGQATLGSANAVWSDGERVVVVDNVYHRVLIWNTFPTVTGQPADVVLGQSSFTQARPNSGGVSARTLKFPVGVTSNGVQLAVSDAGNHRVLIWNTFPTQTFQEANVVLGHADGTFIAPNDPGGDGTPDPQPSDQVFHSPAGLVFHRDRLLVNDNENHRVLVFKAP